MGNQFYFNINYNCNSRCRFCAANYAGETRKIELPLNCVANILREGNTGQEDLIIINGGEPTIHSQFLDILNLASSTEAEIRLFTNGLKLGDRIFFETLLPYDVKTTITVPMFSNDPAQHDYLTGKKGNFDKLWSGLTNLAWAMEKGRAQFEVEVKLLLSKASAPVNHEILKTVEDSFSGRFQYSLNPLILSETVKNNADLFIDSFTRFEKSMTLTMEAAARKQVSLSCSLLPLCILPESYRSRYMPRTPIRSRYGKIIYADPYRLVEEYADRYAYDRCQDCRVLDRCQGFAQDYLDYFGAMEIKPIKGRVWEKTTDDIS